MDHLNLNSLQSSSSSNSLHSFLMQCFYPLIAPLANRGQMELVLNSFKHSIFYSSVMFRSSPIFLNSSKNYSMLLCFQIRFSFQRMKEGEIYSGGGVIFCWGRGYWVTVCYYQIGFGIVSIGIVTSLFWVPFCQTLLSYYNCSLFNYCVYYCLSIPCNSLIPSSNLLFLVISNNIFIVDIFSCTGNPSTDSFFLNNSSFSSFKLLVLSRRSNRTSFCSPALDSSTNLRYINLFILSIWIWISLLQFLVSSCRTLFKYSLHWSSVVVVSFFTRSTAIYLRSWGSPVNAGGFKSPSYTAQVLSVDAEIFYLDSLMMVLMACIPSAFGVSYLIYLCRQSFPLLIASIGLFCLLQFRAFLQNAFLLLGSMPRIWSQTSLL